MGINFTSYSNAHNRLGVEFNIDFLTGIPSLSMDIYHYQEFTQIQPNDHKQALYFQLTLTCVEADEAYKKWWFPPSHYDADGTDLYKKQMTKLLGTKVLQLYDICHCYYETAQDILKCSELESESKVSPAARKLYGGHKSKWFDLMGRLYGVIHKDVAKSRGTDMETWKEIPTVVFKELNPGEGSASKQCWTRYNELRDPNRSKLSTVAQKIVSPLSPLIGDIYANKREIIGDIMGLKKNLSVGNALSVGKKVIGAIASSPKLGETFGNLAKAFGGMFGVEEERRRLKMNTNDLPSKVFTQDDTPIDGMLSSDPSDEMPSLR
jgi:hypothetical protein